MFRNTAPGFGPGNTYTNGDPELGVPPSEVDGEEMTALQEEIANAVEGSGIALNQSDNTQLLQAIIKLSSPAGPGFRNLLINGNFDIWQRGTNFAQIAGAAAAYTADRWLNYLGGGTAAATLSRQVFAVGQVAVPNDPPYFLRYDITTAAGVVKPTLEQRIEGVNTRQAKTVTVSFWAKKTGGSSAGLDLTLVQCFGTGGSPSSNVVTVLGTVANLTTSFALYTFTITLPPTTGKTLGSNKDDYVALQFSLNTAAVIGYEFAQIQLEPGASPSGFERRTFSFEYALARRYYQSSYPVGQGPGSSFPGCATALHGTNATIMYGLNTRFHTPMRKAPTMVWYSITSPATGKVERLDTNAAVTVSATLYGSEETTGAPDLGATDLGDKGVAAHYTATAEL